MSHEYWLDHPDYDDPVEVNEEESFEIILNDVEVVIDPDMSWNYSDTTYPWLDNLETDRYGSVIGYETGLAICDKSDLVDYFSLLIEILMPADPGTYKLDVEATLVFDVSYQDYGEGFLDEDDQVGWESNIDPSDVDTDFNSSKSAVTEFSCKRVVNSATYISADSEGTSFTHGQTTPLGPSRSRGFYLQERWNDNKDEGVKHLSFYDGTDSDYYTARYDGTIQLWEISNEAEGVVETARKDATLAELREALCRLNLNYEQSGEPVTASEKIEDISNYSADGYIVKELPSGEVTISKDGYTSKECFAVRLPEGPWGLGRWVIKNSEGPKKFYSTENDVPEEQIKYMIEELKSCNKNTRPEMMF